MQAREAHTPPSNTGARLDTEERNRLLRSFTVCIGLPVLLVFASAGVANQVLGLLVRGLLFGLPVYLLVLGIYTWTQSDEPLGRLLPRVLLPSLPVDALWSDAWLRRIPVVTLGLILANAAVYYRYPDPQVYAFPLHEPDLWLWSSLTSTFLHADPGHLWGNMFFLWVFGAAVEARLPRWRYLAYYLLFGAASSLYSGWAYVLADLAWGWNRGASGATSGVAGLFIVRCYFSRISVGLPILGPLGFGLPVQMRARVNAVPVLPLPPRRSESTRRSEFVDPCCLRSNTESSASGDIFVSGPPMGSLALRPGDSLAIPRMALSVGFRTFGFPPVCDSSYRAPDSCPGGTSSRWMRQPSLDALRSQYSS